MGLGYGKGRLVPTGKRGPAIYVSYKISQQFVEATDSNGSFRRQKAVVHSIAAEAGQHIDLGVRGYPPCRLPWPARVWLCLTSRAPNGFSTSAVETGRQPQRSRLAFLKA